MSKYLVLKTKNTLEVWTCQVPFEQDVKMHSLLNKNKSTLKKTLRNMCTLFCFFFETVFQVCVSFQSFVSFMFRSCQLSIFLSSAKGGKLRQNTGPHYVHFLLFFHPIFLKTISNLSRCSQCLACHKRILLWCMWLPWQSNPPLGRQTKSLILHKTSSAVKLLPRLHGCADVSLFLWDDDEIKFFFLWLNLPFIYGRFH